MVALACTFAVLVGGSAALGRGRPDAAVRLAAARHYTVEPGDTVWSIARRLTPGRDPRPVVQAIIEANALPDGRLVAGQEVVLP